MNKSGQVGVLFITGLIFISLGVLAWWFLESATPDPLDNIESSILFGLIGAGVIAWIIAICLLLSKK